jgi:hypothetical protein
MDTHAVGHAALYTHYILLIVIKPLEMIIPAGSERPDVLALGKDIQNALDHHRAIARDGGFRTDFIRSPSTCRLLNRVRDRLGTYCWDTCTNSTRENHRYTRRKPAGGYKHLQGRFRGGSSLTAIWAPVPSSGDLSACCVSICPYRSLTFLKRSSDMLAQKAANLGSDLSHVIILPGRRVSPSKLDNDRVLGAHTRADMPCVRQCCKAVSSW